MRAYLFILGFLFQRNPWPVDDHLKPDYVNLFIALTFAINQFIRKIILSLLINLFVVIINWN